MIVVISQRSKVKTITIKLLIFSVHVDIAIPHNIKNTDVVTIVNLSTVVKTIQNADQVLSMNTIPAIAKKVITNIIHFII